MSREFRVLLPSWIQALPEWAKALWHSRWLERVILPRALEGEDPSRFLSGETCIVNLLVSHAHSLVLLSWLSLSLSQCLLSLSPPSRSHFKHASLQASTPLFLLLISGFKHQDLGARHDHNGMSAPCQHVIPCGNCTCGRVYVWLWCKSNVINLYDEKTNVTRLMTLKMQTSKNVFYDAHFSTFAFLST